MEEWIGAAWHRFVMRRADTAHAHAEVRLPEVSRAVTLLLHAGGADLRLATAVPVRVGGPRGFWQRVAGAGRRAALPQVDGEVLALPASVAVFDLPELNRTLYLWWAALASGLDPRLPWSVANEQARQAALRRFPGLGPRWQALRTAELALRPAGEAGSAEARLRAVLGGELDAAAASTLQAADHAPVWTWLLPVAQAAARPGDAGPGPSAGRPPRQAVSMHQRRRARQAEPDPSRAPLLLAYKGESLKTFADPMSMQRAEDNDDDAVDAAVAAEELETLALRRTEGSIAARVRFDLDLPSASADDLPVGPGESLPEWDPRSGTLRPDRVQARCYQAREPSPWQPGPGLRTMAARVRRRMDLQRAAPRWQGGVHDGEEIDLDAWVRQRSAAGPSGRDEPAHRRRVRGQRELASLLLADLSLSTDAHANDRQRIIDVLREALYVFGEALAGSGDDFAMLGFSSVRRQLRLHPLKDFGEAWGPRVQGRLGAIRPGYYTRMGAALRAGTRRLAARPERQRLLLLLTDGKPHDLDGYEGRWGLEDTRQAVLEARRAGVTTFALSIDAEAGEAMPRLFGDKGWAWVRRPEELPTRLAALYAQLSR